MDINLIAPINQLGYGIAGLNILKSLTELGENVALFPVMGRVEAPEEYHTIVKDSMERAAFFNKNAPCIRLWHQHDMSQFVGTGTHVGFPIFELDEFTEREIHHLGSVDKLFVCSDWAKDVVEHELPDWLDTQTHVIPLGVDTDIFYPRKSKRQNTIFFNCGKWEIRKGHDVLVEMFNKAFEYHDNVELWMMNYNPFYSDEQNTEWANLYKNSKLGDKITILPRVQTQKDLAAVMNKAHCGIFPTRAEGWNLELLEMMACDKLVITTDYSGNTEFCNSDNAMLVKPSMMEPAYDGMWFNGQGRWASLGEREITQYVEHMQHVHELVQNGKPSNDAGVKTAQQFSWKNTAQKILEALA